MRLLHRGGADAADEVEAHIGDRGAAVELALGLHLEDDVLEHLLLVLVELQLLQHAQVALDELGGGKAHGKIEALGVVFDQMDDRVEAAVHRAVVVVLIAEILPKRLFLIVRDVHGVADQLVHALILRRRDRHDGDAELHFHLVDVHGAAVARDLVHHVVVASTMLMIAWGFSCRTKSRETSSSLL